MTPADAPPPLPASLIEKYLTQLKSRREELMQFFAHCDKVAATPDEIAAARIHAHSLKGTGRTYGYPSISTAGSALEEAMDRGADQPDLAVLVRRLVTACDDVLAAKRDFLPTSEMPVATTTSPPPRPVESVPTVLVVDDDPDVVGMLQQLLGADANVLTAPGAAKALALIESENPDLVVLDDKMPGTTGMELLEEMQRSGTPIPSQIIMLTANNATPDIIRGISAGAIDYITKPFKPDRLVNRIRSILRCLRMTILIADDDSAVRGLLQHKFRMLGFRLLQAEDGEQTIKMMRDSKPQLAIIDRMMPGLDGLAVLQKMREEESLKRIPVILLTAKRQNKDVVEGFHLGATDYIVKPFMPDEVVARAMRLLGLNEAGRL